MYLSYAEHVIVLVLFGLETIIKLTLIYVVSNLF